jgi:hypothetical protein
MTLVSWQGQRRVLAGQDHRQPDPGPAGQPAAPRPGLAGGPDLGRSATARRWPCGSVAPEPWRRGEAGRVPLGRTDSQHELRRRDEARLLHRLAMLR